MKTSLKDSITHFLTLAIIGYIIITFITLEPNPFKWSEDIRIAYSVTLGALAIVIVSWDYTKNM